MCVWYHKINAVKLLLCPMAGCWFIQVTNSSTVLHCCLKWEVAAECKWGILYMAYATGAKMSGYWQADPSLAKVLWSLSWHCGTWQKKQIFMWNFLLYWMSCLQDKKGASCCCWSNCGQCMMECESVLVPYILQYAQVPLKYIKAAFIVSTYWCSDMCRPVFLCLLVWKARSKEEVDGVEDMKAADLFKVEEEDWELVCGLCVDVCPGRGIGWQMLHFW